ncbi:MAG TPA: GTP-binding protein [Roseiflexaceae bacterium]|nr:GTP-binding protein [Roseiflexaceae bacterium]
MQSHLVLVGGFLGAGKTTLLLAAARRLAARGMRVGLVTNDQGQDLVDTALAASGDIPVHEVTGGCFCCRFPDLVAAVEQLQHSVQPDVILAEPVGSCTDLVATVLRPLRAYHAATVTIAPLTVLVDPLRDLAPFSGDVAYLHEQQLAEAELLVLTKCDLLGGDEAARRMAQLRLQYPRATVLGLSAHNGAGLDEWLAHCEGQAGALQHALDLDYGRYSDAEAALGWLNASGELHATRPFAADMWLAGALTMLDQALFHEGAAIAHIKLHLETPAATLKASLTRSGGPITWDLHRDGVRAEHARLLINARVHCDPAILERVVRRLSQETPSWITCTLTRLDSFSPAPPQPTYRLNGAA